MQNAPDNSINYRPFKWYDHKAALWYLFLLYRKPKVFKEWLKEKKSFHRILEGFLLLIQAPQMTPN